MKLGSGIGVPPRSRGVRSSSSSTSLPTEGQARPVSILFSVPVGVNATQKKKNKKRKEE